MEVGGRLLHREVTVPCRKRTMRHAQRMLTPKVLRVTVFLIPIDPIAVWPTGWLAKQNALLLALKQWRYYRVTSSTASIALFAPLARGEWVRSTRARTYASGAESRSR